jgi:hypothetical protein
MKHREVRSIQQELLLETLKDITTEVVLNVDFCEDAGLTHGKTGAILYLYLYSEQQKNEESFAIADSILLDVLQTLGNKDLSYESGLAGIVDCLRFLNDCDHIEIPNPQDFFYNVNVEISRNYTTPFLNLNSIKTTKYLLAETKLENTTKDSDLEILTTLERLVDHLELIDLKSDDLRIQEWPDFKKGVETPSGILHLMNTFEQISLISDFLTYILQKKICLGSAYRQLKVFRDKNTKLLDNLIKLTQARVCPVENFVLLNLLSSTINTQLLIENTPLSQQKHLLECLAKVVSRTLYKWQIDFRSTSAPIHLKSIFELIQINSRLYSEQFEEYILKYIAIFSTSFDSSSYLRAFHINNRKSFSLGLSGLSGFGITLLMSLDKKHLPSSKFLKNLNFS